MNNPSRYERLFRPTDTEDVRAQIRQIVDRHCDPDRLTDHQLKIGKVNYYPGKGNDALRTEMIVDGMVKPLQMELDWNRDYGITRATFSIGQRATSITNGAGNTPAPFIDSRAYA